MAPILFTEFSDDDKNTLKQIARESIEHGLLHKKPLPVDPDKYSPLLQSNTATFVTLQLHNHLRGCIGTLQAYQPLVKDVSQHAFDAAFKDPRFTAVNKEEAEQLEIHISILTPAEDIEFTSEDDLLSQLEPGVDGLIIEDGYHRATFLPSVWEQLPDRRQFLEHLKQKAGLSANHWSDSFKAQRYRTISI